MMFEELNIQISMQEIRNSVQLLKMVKVVVQIYF